MKMRLKFAMLGLCAIGLAGCGAETAAVAGGAAMVSFVGTDKTVVDHVASAASGKDCSVLYTNNGGDYCRPEIDAEAEAIRRAENQLYCYNTLGEVTCYDSPDPYANNQIPVR